MPARRTFDYEKLRELYEQDPDMPRWQMARELTEHNARLGRPQAVSVRAVISALYTKKDEWGLRTARIDILPKEWKIDPDHANDDLPRRTRAILRIRAGEDVSAEARKRAGSLERRLRESRQVIDYDPESTRLEIRPARPDELDHEGEILDIFARPESKIERTRRLLGELDPQALAQVIDEASRLRDIR